MNLLNKLRYERTLFFTVLGMRRCYRIMFCSFIIALVWCFADFRSGNLEANYINDIICLGMGILVERLIPWGKPQNIEQEATRAA